MSKATVPSAVEFGARALAAGLLCTVIGCSYVAPRPAIPAPAGAIAEAVLAQDRVAILAGNDAAKAIFIVDLKTGAVQRSYGVTREATDLATETDSGPLLLSIGGSHRGRNFGAVERWGVDGRKLAVVPMPAQALGITRDVDGVSFVLLAGKGNARAAVAVDSPSLVVERPIPLDAGARGLQLCKIGAASYLVYSDDAGFVTVRSIDSGDVLRGQIAADDPDCGDEGHIYAIRKSFASRTVIVIAAPSMQQVGTIPVSNDAIALDYIGNRQLLELDSTSRAASLQRLSAPQIVTKTST